MIIITIITVIRWVRIIIIYAVCGERRRRRLNTRNALHVCRGDAMSVTRASRPGYIIQYAHGVASYHKNNDVYAHVYYTGCLTNIIIVAIFSEVMKMVKFCSCTYVQQVIRTIRKFTFELHFSI